MTALDNVLAEATRGNLGDAVMLMRLLSEAASEAEARASLARAIAGADAAGTSRLEALQRLWDAHPGAWAIVRSTLHVAAHDRADATGEAALRGWSAVFDQLAATAPEAGVALYALGSPELLAAATAEVVALVERLEPPGAGRDVLDLGCGIGRLAAALAPRVRSVLGSDVSSGMVEEARRRCSGVANARFTTTSGRDLGPVRDDSIDLVLAADVFPYLVQAGVAVAHIHEFARVLRPEGAALILNFSYRGSIALDTAEVAEAAAHAGLNVLRSGSRDLRLWDAPTFHLRKP